MPCAVDYILEGLAENLELERELGCFAVEFGRELLATLPKEREVRATPTTVTSVESSAARKFDFVFLHHAPLNDAGVEMMAKIVLAMKQTSESAPIVFTGEKPAAKIYVVLGQKALRQWYDGVTLSLGGWFRDADSEVLLVSSPEDISRFGMTPAVQQMKREMWNSLKQVMAKVSC